jgi:hypothetical protein
MTSFEGTNFNRTSFGKGTAIGMALALTVSVVTVRAQEKKLRRAELPAAVRATIDRETKGATIKGFATEREGGKKVYEAETMVSGHSRDLQVAEDGTLNEIEEEVAFERLPDAVKAGLQAKAAGATIAKVESLTKGGRLVAYEATTRKGAKKGEVQVGPSGETLAHAE